MWPFKRKPAPPQIPKFAPPAEEVKPEPKPEPIEVLEDRDPSDSMIIRVRKRVQDFWGR